MSLPMAYNIKKRSAKMAKGGMAHCAHGGPAYCNAGCYADGGEVESAPEASAKAMEYEMSVDEPMDEMPNKPRPQMMGSGRRMARMMMAKGGVVNSEDAFDAGAARTRAIEDQPNEGMDNEDIDVMWTTPHDDNLSSEGEYPLMEEEGYEEGHQAKMRRKGGLLERVMSKIHSR